MTMHKTLKLLLKASGITQKNFARMLGLKRQSNIYARLNRQGMTMDNALSMLDLLGYEMLVRAKTTGRRREDEIIITKDDEV